MNKDLKGIHHITAMTDDAERNYKFFTEILGMRLVKKTVNQDDIQTYHTYYADHKGSPGTTMTFFDFPQTANGSRGTNSISRSGLRVPSDAALDYYKDRFEEFDIKHDGIQEVFGTKVLPFAEADGQLYQLVSDENNEGVEAGEVWERSPVPAEYAINGLGLTEITVSYYDDFINIFKDLYSFREVTSDDYATLLEVGEGGNGARVIIRRDAVGPQSIPGNGEVHHMSFRVEDDAALEAWLDVYNKNGMQSSGIVNRFYFGALYTRIGHVLIELSTDGPGFTGDEPYETLGESLALPPEFEARRDYIEGVVRPFDTTIDRSND